MIYNQLGNTDMKISNYSLGASAFGSVYSETDDQECVELLKTALKRGVNLIDTSPWYGHGKAETVLGKILPQLDRSSCYINTKVGRYEKDISGMFDFSYERTIKSVDESLKRMNIDYIDVIQVHDFEFAPNLEIIVNETLPALQKVKEQGKARYIGITAYPIDVLKSLIQKSKVKIDSILSYCHGSMNDNSLQDHMAFFESQGIGVINASGLSMGLLTDRGPAKWHPAGVKIREACKNAAVYCQERGSNISRLALYFSISQPKIASTLYSTSKLAKLEANLDVVENGITDEEKQLMGEVVERFFDPLESKSWEGVEVESYWKKLKKASEGGSQDFEYA
uniref:L-galactose dehydrogenase-like isoform X1 n=1 Tax=Styela clava TaxID=7725 RepID=UPI001939CEB0|nr:L-galactose dehydrogenase-like isoform X1 [Styela clava]